MLCSHLTSAFAFVSMSLSKFNIASMVTQTKMQRMGYSLLQCSFDSDVDANANVDVKCEQTLSGIQRLFRLLAPIHSLWTFFSSSGIVPVQAMECL